jgi:cytochrome P450
MAITSGSDLSFDPYRVELDGDPNAVYARMSDEAPLYRNEERGFWALSRFADIEAALRDVDRFSSAHGNILEVVKAAPKIPDGMFINEDPPAHTLHRGLVARAFTPRRMREIEGRIRAFCRRCLEPFEGAERFDFVADLGNELPMRAIGLLLGIPEELQPAARDLTDRRLHSEEGTPMAVRKDRYFTAENFAEYVDWRRQNPSDDLVTELLTVEVEDGEGLTRKLTRDEVLMFVGVLAGAGFETTGRLIGWLGRVLADHPDARREVAEDRSLLAPVVDEVLRYEPTGASLARYVTVDTELHGEVVPAGSPLVLVVASGNRDPRRFTDPDRFDVHRKDGAHLTFGYGAHFCLGASLARLEGRVALDEVLNRWVDWEVDEGNAERVYTSTMRGWSALPVVIG